jgi:hypothetical protein
MSSRSIGGVLVILGAGCGATASDGSRATFEVHPGVEIVSVTGAAPRVPLTLYDAAGTRLLTMITDDTGNAHFAYVPLEHITLESGLGARFPLVDGHTLKRGEGYVIRNDTTTPVDASAPFTVLGVGDVPDTSLYDRQSLTGVPVGLLQTPEDAVLQQGFQYVEVRDGVKLSVMVRFPDPIFYGDGPWPTVIEYSGYSPSNPWSVEPASQIAGAFGFATVGVNMRGTGCSGGVFDVFNPAQHADGYDVVEVIARQPWALGGRVGMVGISYSGISQLFVASTRPPSLAAITPLSVIADPWESQWPAGIYNRGFTRQWLEQRDAEAMADGMSWVERRVAGGDEVCRQDLALRSQNIDFESFLRGLEMRPRDADDRSLPRLVDRIDVPVLLAGAFQDEQTGAFFGDMLDRFTPSAARFVLYNGRHPDAVSTLVITRWYEFLELFVAGRVPRLHPGVRAGATVELSNNFATPGLDFEPDRYETLAPGDLSGAMAVFEAEPRVRVLFENGAGGDVPGGPIARFAADQPSWPPPAATARRWYLGPDGTLTDAPPTAADAADTYEHDPEAGTKTFFGSRGYEILAPLWDINWTEFPQGRLVSYLTEPFAQDVVLAGPGRADLWMSCDVDDVSVQVTLSEVRPDGVEYLVQSGWLRLGHRKTLGGAAAGDLRIARSYSREDFAPVPRGEPFEAEIALPSVAHALRAGSRLRVTISAPGRNHGLWEFEAPDYGDAAPVHTVLRSAARPSSVVLPVVEGVPVAPGLPACPSLRGQPCRAYRAAANVPAP